MPLGEWTLTCKDQTGWPDNFVEQSDVWGYLNNPRWTDDPEPGEDHNYTGREDEEPQVWDIPDNNDYIVTCKDQEPWEI